MVSVLYVTGLELTTLTNLLFIIIPQGYLPCLNCITGVYFCPYYKLFIHSRSEWLSLTTQKGLEIEHL